MNMNKNDIDINNLTSEQEGQIAEIQGKRLAYLLDKIKWSEEIKQDWLTILPTMNARQIDEFINTLEQYYIEQETEDVNQEFIDKLKELYDKYSKQQEQRKNKALSALGEIEKELDALEKKNNN